MTKEYNNIYWTITADSGKLLVNSTAKVSASYIFTADENAEGWEEMAVESVPSWDTDEDITDREALEIITGGES